MGWMFIAFVSFGPEPANDRKLLDCNPTDQVSLIGR